MLTKGLDNIPGTSGDDTIIGSIDTSGDNPELNTLSSLDVVNGGAGVDTLKIMTAEAAINLPNMSNVEIVQIESAAGATVDTSKVAGVTNLNVLKAASAIKATGAATTDVSVTTKAVAANLEVLGGKDITVKVTDVAADTNKIAVGDTVTPSSANAPKGNVVVEATAKAADTVGADIAMGTIAVTGGKTISVTQKVGNASGLVADGAYNGGTGGTTTTHTQGAVTVTASTETTSVTLKQDAAATAINIKAVDKVDEVATVTFTKLDNTQSVTVGDLTFTATKDLTAEQVAAAFANLCSNAPLPTDLTSPPATTAKGDTQGSGVFTNGTYTGSLAAGWSSAAANGSTVTFTGIGDKADLSASSVGATAPTVVTTTQGKDFVEGKNVLGVVNGVVKVVGAAALKTVTVDGYDTSDTVGTNGITGTTNTVLDTIKLANGKAFAIQSAASTLALNLDNVQGTVKVASGTTTLNATVTTNKFNTATLASATAETINVSGTGMVAGNTSSGLTATTLIDTTGMTEGTATFTIANGTVTSYTGGAGADKVTISNANVAISKTIDLGAGDDTLTLNSTGTAVVPTATLKGGEGTDTIAMTAANAKALSADTKFADKIESFEKLSITDKVAAATTVNMANMDGIKYVVSNNSGGTAAGATAVYAKAVAGLTQGDTIAFTYNGSSLTATIGATAGATATDAEVQTAINTALTDASKASGSVVASFTNSNADLTLTAAGNPITDTLTGGAYNDVDGKVDDRSVPDATDSPKSGAPASALYANAVTHLTANDTIAFTYNNASLTATIGSTSGAFASATEVQNAINAALATVGIATGSVVASFTGTGNADLTLTAAGNPITDTLTGGKYTDGGGNNNENPANTTGTLAAAKAVYAGAVAGLTKGDTIAFTYNGGSELTATIGAFTNAIQVSDVQTAINLALVGAGKAANSVVASFTNTGSADLTLTAAGNPATDTLTGGAYADVDGARPDKSVASPTNSPAGATSPTLTLDKMANDGTLELVGDGAGVIVKMLDATGTTDSFNLVTKVVGTGLTFGTVDVAGVETLKLNAVDTDTTSIETASLTVKADKAASLSIDGNSHVTLSLDSTTTNLATINAAELKGNLSLDLSAHNGVAVTVTGGSGADTIKASVGTNAKADVIVGGAGNDTITAGTNGATLTGGEGNDLFILTASSASNGTKESNTYSTITDFAAGDLLQLQYYSSGTSAAADVTGFAKLAANLNEGTAKFADFANAAAKQAAAGQAVWFNFDKDAYVVVDSNTSVSDTFVNGEDLVIKLTGIDGANLSWNSDYATVALV